MKDNYPVENKFTEISYRPFDKKWTYYTGNSKGFHCYPRNEVMQHFVRGENIGLAIGRQGHVIGTDSWDIVSITDTIMDFNYYRRGGEVVFPLYLYPEEIRPTNHQPRTKKNAQSRPKDPSGNRKKAWSGIFSRRAGRRRGLFFRK